MSDQFSIKDLPTNISENKRYWISGKTMLVITNLLGRLWNGDNVGVGPGITKRGVSGAGYSLSSSGGGGASSGSIHPWKVSMRENPDTPGQFQALVYLNSDLLKSLRPDDGQTVTGLNTWFDLINNDVIWIEIPISSYAPTGASIDSYGQGDDAFVPTAQPWTEGGYVEAVDNENTSSPQNKLRIMLAYTQPDEITGNPVLYQKAYTNFYLSYFPSGILARPALIALPSPYGRYGPFE